MSQTTYQNLLASYLIQMKNVPKIFLNYSNSVQAYKKRKIVQIDMALAYLVVLNGCTFPKTDHPMEYNQVLEFSSKLIFHVTPSVHINCIPFMNCITLDPLWVYLRNKCI